MTTTDASVAMLLPHDTLPKSPENEGCGEWQPKSYLNPPRPPPNEEAKLQEELLTNARAMLGDNTRLLKKTRPRRTVDYFGGMGRWGLMRKMRPNPYYLPQMRPSPPNIIDLLPTKAYQDNVSTSLCTKYVHTSTNKIRCPVNVVTWTPEGRRVLTGSTSGEFTLWNGLTFNFETILQAHDSAICAMTFTHNGAYIASADKTGVIKYFEPNMNNLTAWQGSSSREAIRGISFSPDDTRFATASDDSSVRIWDFQESRVESALTGHGWDVKCVEWHPTKGLLVSGSKDSQIKFWDPRTGTVLTTLHQHKNTVQALAWSPNGNMVASASRDQTVRIFDIRALKELRLLKGHKKEVCSVTWHPVQQIVVSGGSEGSILHWDMSTSPEPQAKLSLPQPKGASTSPSVDAMLAAVQPTPVSPPRATLSQAHDSNVWSLAFHPLGHILVSGSNDHTTRFWSRERPGDATSVFSGGGEKPVVTADEEDDIDDDTFTLPGFVAAATAGANAMDSSNTVSGAVDFMSQQQAAVNMAASGIRGDGMNGYSAGGTSGAGAGATSGSIPGMTNRSDGDFIPGFGSGDDTMGQGASNSFGNGDYDGRYRDRDKDRERYSGRDDDWGRDRYRDQREYRGRERSRERDRDWDDRERRDRGSTRGWGRPRGRY